MEEGVDPSQNFNDPQYNDKWQFSVDNQVSVNDNFQWQSTQHLGG